MLSFGIITALVLGFILSFCFAFYMAKLMDDVRNSQAEWLSTFPRFTYSGYSEYSFCEQCQSTSRDEFRPVCGKCGDATRRVTGRWKIKEYAPLFTVGAFGEPVYIGSGYKEKVGFIKKNS